MSPKAPPLDVLPVRQLYDRIAAEYDARYLDPYSRLYDDVTWDHLGRWLDRLPRDAPLLDLAAGTGYVAIELLRRGFTDVTAVDLSPSMLGVLGRKAETMAQGRERLTVRVADFHDLSELPAAHYAAVLCQGSALSCTSQPFAALEEIRRRLAPGGWLNLSVHNRCGSVEKILSSGQVGDLEAALGCGRWYWYENGEPVHEMHLFADEELDLAASELDLTLASRIGKVVLSRGFVETLEPGSPRWQAARRYALDHAADPRLCPCAEYTDVVLRARS